MPRVSTPATFEECIDDLNDCINMLERYPHTVLAFALRSHLSGLLQALLVHELWTREEVASFLADLEEEALLPESNQPRVPAVASDSSSWPVDPAVRRPG
jgi:hypothetical protein